MSEISPDFERIQREMDAQMEAEFGAPNPEPNPAAEARVETDLSTPPLPPAEAAPTYNRPEPIEPIDADSETDRQIEQGPRPIEPLRPEVPTPPETRPQPSDLEQRLERARGEYLKAKEALKGIGIFTRHAKKIALSTEEHHAFDKYREVRSEYMGTELERFLAEKDKLAEAELAQIQGDKGTIKRVYDQYKKLGQYNLIEQGAKLIGKEYKAKGRLAKMVNARTAISLGLLGVGLGAGAATAVGAAAIAGKRGLSGIGSAVGSYDVAMLVRQKLGRKEVERALAEVESPLQAGDLLAQMEIRAGLDGKTLAELKQDELYQRLSDRNRELVAQEASRFVRDIGPEELTDDERVRYRNIANPMHEIEASARAQNPNLRPEELFNNPEYQRLFDQLTKIHLEIISRVNPDALTEYFNLSLNQAESDLKRNKIYEKNMRKGIGAVAGAVGLLVGSGALAKIFGHETSLSQPKTAGAIEQPSSASANDLPKIANPPSIPKLNPLPPISAESAELKFDHPANVDFTGPGVITGETIPAGGVDSLEALHKVDLLHNGKPTGAFAEIHGDELAVHIGNRGIEGSLLDLKDAQPEQYDKMINWLENQPYNQGITKPDQLIHRYVTNYASEHDMTVDQAGKNLSRLMEGKIHINADGSLEINQEHLNFLPDQAPADTSGLGVHNADADLPYTGLDEASLPASPGINVPAAEFAQSNLGAEEVGITSGSIDDGYADTLSSLSPESQAAKLADAHEIASGSVEKTSDALQLILDNDSKQFLKQVFKLSPTNLNRVGNQSITSFLNKYTRGSELFQTQFKGLYDSISDEYKQNGSSKTIRQFVLAAATKYKELK